MAKIITYRNEGPKGVFCQLKLESGERILISMTQRNTKIFRLGFLGLVPMGTIWESSDIEEMIKIFADPINPEKQPLDAIIEKLIGCKSIEEVKSKITKENPLDGLVSKYSQKLKVISEDTNQGLHQNQNTSEKIDRILDDFIEEIKNENRK